MEWWDGAFLEKGKQQDFAHANNYDKDSYNYEDLNPDNCETIGLVHHPKLVEPAVPPPKPKPELLLYTKKEKKKLRRKERLEKQREEHDLIKVGLLEAPEPKLTRANMMKLYKDEAVINPSLIEMKMQEQVAQRLAQHQKRNEDRKLKPQEKKVKKLKKLIGDRTGQLYIAVFKVEDLSNPKNRFKVDVNAQQNFLNGQVVLCPSIRCNMVLVEGTIKAIRRYIKLMLKRIDWNKKDDIEEIKEETEVKEEINVKTEGEDNKNNDNKNKNNKKKEQLDNHCYLVWQGVSGKQSIKDFVIDEVPNYVSGRNLLEPKGLAQYWDMVKNYDDKQIL